MQGSTSRETHFRSVQCLISKDVVRATDCSPRVYITSDVFKSKMQPARHRMVYTALKDEISAEGGIHALQLRTRTVEEDEKAKAKDNA